MSVSTAMSEVPDAAREHQIKKTERVIVAGLNMYTASVLLEAMKSLTEEEMMLRLGDRPGQTKF